MFKKWCFVAINKNKGWMQKINLWGVTKKETSNIPFCQLIIDQIWKLNF